MSGWVWCIFGLIFLVAEVIVPSGFYLGLLGVAALGVALLTGISLMPTVLWPLWTWQALAFALLGATLLVTLSGRLRHMLNSSNPRGGGGSGDAVGSLVTLTTAIAPGEFGSAELWGTQWRVKNIDTRILDSKSNGLVVGSEGITLLIKGSS